VAICPYCGLPPTVTTEDDEDDEPWFYCENGHSWAEDPANP
jgi:hypothetical protein